MKRKSIVSRPVLYGMSLAMLLSTLLPAVAQQDPAVGGTKRCTAYWNAHKADLKAAGKTKKAFMGPCLSGTWVFQ